MKLVYILIALLFAMPLLAEECASCAAGNCVGIPEFDTQWSALKDSLQAHPGDAMTLLSMAYTCLSQSDRIVSQLEAQSDSLAPAVLFGIANYRYSLGDYATAVGYYEQLNAHYPKWSCPWRHKGTALLELNRLPEAKAALEQAIAVQPNHADAYLALARVLLAQEKPKLALAMFEKGQAVMTASPEGAAEIDPAETQFLRLDLLRANHKKADYEALKADLLQRYPGNPYWKDHTK